MTGDLLHVIDKQDIAAVMSAYHVRSLRKINRANIVAALVRNGVYQAVMYGADGAVIYGWETDWQSGRRHPWTSIAVALRRVKKEKLQKEDGRHFTAPSQQSSLAGGELRGFDRCVPFWLMDETPDSCGPPFGA